MASKDTKLGCTIGIIMSVVIVIIVAVALFYQLVLM